MLYLISGSITPGEGIYRFENLNQEQFADACETALKDKTFRCQIFDKSACELLSNLTGIIMMPPAPDKKGGNFTDIELQDRDQLIIVQITPVRTVIETVGNGTPNIHLRTTRVTHYNDNLKGIQSLLELYTTVAGSEDDGCNI